MSPPPIVQRPKELVEATDDVSPCICTLILLPPPSLLPLKLQRISEAEEWLVPCLGLSSPSPYLLDPILQLGGVLLYEISRDLTAFNLMKMP